jgi:hypothetical protein
MPRVCYTERIDIWGLSVVAPLRLSTDLIINIRVS